MSKALCASQQFWKNLILELEKRGNPFKINPSQKQYAVVNRNDLSFGKTGFFIDYLYTYRIIRMGLWIPNEIELHEKLKTFKDSIKNKLSYEFYWDYVGVKNKNARWIKREICIDDYTEEEAINEVINILVEFIPVINEYVKI